jgi:hypothetical protein
MRVIRSRRSFLAVADALAMADVRSEHAVCPLVGHAVLTWQKYDADDVSIDYSIGALLTLEEALAMHVHPRWG